MTLDWNPPEGVTVDQYLIYRDGSLVHAAAGDVTSYIDTERLQAGQLTRYHVSAINALGAESVATPADPAFLVILEPN